MNLDRSGCQIWPLGRRIEQKFLPSMSPRLPTTSEQVTTVRDLSKWIPCLARIKARAEEVDVNFKALPLDEEVTGITLRYHHE